MQQIGELCAQITNTKEPFSSKNRFIHKKLLTLNSPCSPLNLFSYWSTKGPVLHHADGWLVVLRFITTLTDKAMAVRETHVFPGFLRKVLT